MRKKRDYLIIPVSNIALNNDQTYDANRIFNHYEVANIHRLVVLKLFDIDIFNDTKAYELLTNEIFHFEGSIIKRILSPYTPNTIKGHSDTVTVEINPKLVTIDEVKAFYQEIIDHGEANDYQKAVRELLLSNKKKLSFNEKVRSKQINE